jgi:formate dehydrogenase-N alpha subunit
MTNHWIDIRNADCVFVIGANPAENHPISFKWITEAMERGATMIHVDPRFSHTSARADVYAPIRSGTDIAFVGGMIKFVLDDMEQNPDNYNMEYVRQYTNAAFIINPAFKFSDGLFGELSGLRYTVEARNAWKYGDPVRPETDPTLKHPNCVFQLLKKHFTRYDVDTVCRITGTPRETYLKVAETFAATGARGKAGTILYAMGATQHTYGTQNIRAFGILQSLLGNMGIAGGGINALRGTSNVQGSTDMGLLANTLPGYLNIPVETDADMASYLTRVGKNAAATITPRGLAGDNSVNWWANADKYLVSMLKAWYGKAANKENDFAFAYLPKCRPGVDYTHMGLFEAMGDGKIQGMWVWGQNPAAGGPNSNGEREALGNLEWLVMADVWMNETSEFWRRPGASPSAIETEVFLLPVACSYEKEGSVTNSGRWAQWRYKAIDPPGQARPDLEIMNELMAKLKSLYASESSPKAKPVVDLDWNYGPRISSDAVAREINGFDLSTGKLLSGFSALKNDGTTSSGNWLYCNQYSEEEGNKTARRGAAETHPKQIGQFSNWAWCWPMNRRIIYNRASVDLDGKPWDSERPVVQWDSSAKKWLGDVIDGNYPPINVAEKGARCLPFIMREEGVARLWGYGLADGPLPEAYEPWESPLARNVMSGTTTAPCAFIGKYRNERGSPERFPYVGTTYRCTEHWQTGIMTRNLPWIVEMMPAMYVELGDAVADQRGIKNGDRVVVSSARGKVEAVAVVTKRFQPLLVDNKPVHQIGVIWAFGYSGMVSGDSGNLLTAHVGDANSTIPEFKTFLCDIRKA